MSLIECFMQEREVASLSLLLKLQGKVFCHLLFPGKTSRQTNTKSRNLLSWFLLTVHTKEMQKYQVYVFCSSGKLLIWVLFAGAKTQRAAVASVRLANNLKETTKPQKFLNCNKRWSDFPLGWEMEPVGGTDTSFCLQMLWKWWTRGLVVSGSNFSLWSMGIKGLCHRGPIVLQEIFPWIESRVSPILAGVEIPHTSRQPD